MKNNAQTVDATNLIAAMDLRVRKAKRDLQWVEEQQRRPDVDQDYRNSFDEAWLAEKSELIEAQEEQRRVLKLLGFKR